MPTRSAFLIPPPRAPLDADVPGRAKPVAARPAAVTGRIAAASAPPDTLVPGRGTAPVRAIDVPTRGADANAWSSRSVSAIPSSSQERSSTNARSVSARVFKIQNAYGFVQSRGDRTKGEYGPDATRKHEHVRSVRRTWSRGFAVSASVHKEMQVSQSRRRKNVCARKRGSMGNIYLYRDEERERKGKKRKRGKKVQVESSS